MDAGSDGSASLLSVALPVVEDEVCELLVVVPPEEPDPAGLFAEGELPPPPSSARAEKNNRETH